MRMARSKDGDGIKSALIIAEVQKRPMLYDANHQAYGERVLKTQSWEEVCAAVLPQWASMSVAERHTSGKEIQKRWRSIRDSYTKAYRQGKCSPTGGVGGGGRRTQHQKQMAFLYHALQRKVPRTSTDKRVPDPETTNPLSPDVPLSIVKLENHKEETSPPAKTYQNKKRCDRVPSVDSAPADPDAPLDIPRELKIVTLLDTPPAGRADAATETEHPGLPDTRGGYAETPNPSLEIKIDANAILPEDHFDDDRLFMNSLLPFFKKMEDGTRLACRIEVLKIIKYALQGRSFEVVQGEGVAVKREARAGSDPAAAEHNRFGRKRKSVTPFTALLEPAPKRRGRGRPRKTSLPHWEEPATATEAWRGEGGADEASLRGRRRAARPLERDSRLTPDEEEMYRATSVAQLKPPQFLKMYNLEPTKKPAAPPATAPAAPDTAAKKETS